MSLYGQLDRAIFICYRLVLRYNLLPRFSLSAYVLVGYTHHPYSAQCLKQRREDIGSVKHSSYPYFRRKLI